MGCVELVWRACGLCKRLGDGSLQPLRATDSCVGESRDLLQRLKVAWPASWGVSSASKS